MTVETSFLEAKSSAREPLRPAPLGFTDEQWRTFDRDGLVSIPGALDPDEVAAYLDATKACLARYPSYDPAHTWKIRNVVQEHPLFRDLIDHERHVGYAYDLFGDQTQLIQADVFVRPTGGVVNHWHVDGPRVVPYRSFSPILPLKLRIGYWLTDVSEPEMGNLVYLPGSHRATDGIEHGGIGELEGQKVLCCAPGTITIAHCSLWHRVVGNASPRTRINLFLSYAPSWVAGYYSYDRDWIATLSREQRIILRAYADREDASRPPPSDLPLFDDPAAPVTGPEVELHKIRRLTRYERRLARL